MEKNAENLKVEKDVEESKNQSLLDYMPEEPSLAQWGHDQTILDLVRESRTKATECIKLLEGGGWKDAGEIEGVKGFTQNLNNNHKTRAVKVRFEVSASIDTILDIIRDPKSFETFQTSAYDGRIIEKVNDDLQFERHAISMHILLLNRDFCLVSYRIKFTNGNQGVMIFSCPHDQFPAAWLSKRAELTLFVYLKKLDQNKTRANIYLTVNMCGLLSYFFIDNQLRDELHEFILFRRFIEARAGNDNAL